MKILHTGDLHLDSAFCGGGETHAVLRRERQREVLKKIFELAESEACDAVLIAGDLFDTSFVTPETRALCISLFESFGKPVIAAPGNHDPFVDGSFWKSELPENVYVFSSSELQYFDIPELSLTVGGYAFTASALPVSPLESQHLKAREGEKYLILCAHCDLDMPTSRYAPVMSSDITRLGFDYAALGHVHNTDRAQTGNIRYCGFAEGRSFDERGEGGVLIISDEIGELSAQRHVISERRYVLCEVNADGMSAPEEIESAIEREIEKHTGNGTAYIRLELCGVVSDGALPELGIIEKKERSGVGSLEITDCTLSLPDGGYLEKDTTLRGEFYRSLRAGLCSDDPAERKLSLRALKIGLAAIDGKSFTEGGQI